MMLSGAFVGFAEPLENQAVQAFVILHVAREAK